MGNSRIRGQRSGIHREAMILAGYHHLSSIYILHWVVRAVMTEFHLDGFGTTRQPQQLMPHANAKNRYSLIQESSRCGDGIVAGFWITRSVGKKYAIGLQRQNLVRGSLSGKYRDPAVALPQLAQYVPFDSKIQRSNMKPWILLNLITMSQPPFAFVPLIRLRTTHHFGQVHPGKAGELSRLLHGLGFVRKS